jgi:hypothetical protein
MHTFRRLVAVASVTALAGAFAAGPAGADSAEVYTGSAAARGLNISVVNPVDNTTVQATLGAAAAKAESNLTATATGQGEVVPPVLATVKTASANTGAQSVDAGQGCAQAQAVAGVVNLGIACGSASASVANGLPSAISSGSIAGLGVNGSTALSQLNAVTTPLGQTLGGVLDTVCSDLSATCDATTTVKDLVTSILQTKTLDVSVGQSDSKVITDAGKIASTASASGAVIKLLPLPQVNGLPSTDPVATISVGAASATATYDRNTGTSTPSFDPAVVRVTFNTVLTNALGLHEVEVPAGKDITILQGTPLESRIIVGAGSKTVSADGKTANAVADGVSLRLLEPLGASSATALDGGITLQLAHAEAGIGGAPAVVTAAPKAPVVHETPRELPRTGGNPFIPMAGVGVLALAVVTRRTWLRTATDNAEK